ncbi:MAG: FAD-dependent monooxygenase [Burkholderiales bacterium]|nr:FAD-dependent monooxygenase [Burkholderiales bacterium]
MDARVIRADVCVVGDGAVGRAAALGFSQAGLRVALVGAGAQVPAADVQASWDVRVFALNQLAFSLLDTLKVWGALDQSRIAPVAEMKVMDAATDADGAIGFDAYGACMDELAWIVEDRNLNAALASALRFAPHVQQLVGLGRTLSTTADGVQVQLEDGRSVQAALLVGADGAQSWVRAQCDIGLDYRSYYQQGVVTNFECELPHHGVAHQWFVGEQGIIALLPLPGNRVSLVWSAPDALVPQLLSEPLSALAKRLAVYCAPVLGRLTPVQPELVRAFPLRLMRPHAMIAPRVALVGDAAHVVHPLAGHGMNLGFGDVRDLLSVVVGREPYRDCGDARLLRRYQRMRREEVALMQWTTDGLARLFGSDLPAVRLLRGAGLNLLNQLPVLKRELMSHAMGKR